MQFDIKKFGKDYSDLCLKVLKDLCLIPSPSHMEDRRAEYILNFVKGCGYNDAYIDSAKNVIWKLEGETSTYSLFMAHTDTVFPDLEPMPFNDDGEWLYSPGVGDDTTCLAQLLCVSKFLKENNYKPNKSLMFSANSCEEGLGNLKGCRQLFKDFDGKIDFMCSFDGKYFAVDNSCVGSHRYNVKAITEGGHSFGMFGKSKNAIQVLSNIINDIYSIEVPNKPNEKTTYNVGTISGGTSVNTIAQSAEMLCEYRSSDLECLNFMKERFNEIFKKAEKDCVSLEVKLVGDRPCMGNVDLNKLSIISDKAAEIQKKYNGNVDVKMSKSSTDCNIPFSLGILATCMGTYEGYGTHTREEKVKKDSIEKGLCIELDAILNLYI